MVFSTNFAPQSPAGQFWINAAYSMSKNLKPVFNLGDEGWLGQKTLGGKQKGPQFQTCGYGPYEIGMRERDATARDRTRPVDLDATSNTARRRGFL
jgi:hypothetical protein